MYQNAGERMLVWDGTSKKMPEVVYPILCFRGDNLKNGLLSNSMKIRCYNVNVQAVSLLMCHYIFIFSATATGVIGTHPPLFL